MPKIYGNGASGRIYRDLQPLPDMAERPIDVVVGQEGYWYPEEIRALCGRLFSTRGKVAEAVENTKIGEVGSVSGRYFFVIERAYFEIGASQKAMPSGGMQRGAGLKFNR